MNHRLKAAISSMLVLVLVSLFCAAFVHAEAVDIVKEKKEYTYLMMERDLKAL